MSVDDQLRHLWTSYSKMPATFSRPEVLFKEARKIIPNLKKHQVLEFIQKQNEYNTFKEYKKTKNSFRFTHVNRPGHLIVIDVFYLKKFGHKGGVKFLLVAVDAFSSFTVVRGMKSLKNSKTHFMKIYEIFEKKFKIDNLLMDKGSEMYAIKKFAESKGVDVFWAPDISPNKSARAERQILFLRRKMSRILKHNPKLLPLTAAQRATEIYNSTVNVSTGFAPNDVTKDDIGLIIRRRMDNQFKQLTRSSFIPKFSINDIVKLRITRKSTVFLKSNEPSYSQDLYIIIDIKPTAPMFSYVIKKIGGQTKSASIPENYLQLVENRND